MSGLGQVDCDVDDGIFILKALDFEEFDILNRLETITNNETIDKFFMLFGHYLKHVNINSPGDAYREVFYGHLESNEEHDHHKILKYCEYDVFNDSTHSTIYLSYLYLANCNDPSFFKKLYDKFGPCDMSDHKETIIEILEEEADDEFKNLYLQMFIEYEKPNEDVIDISSA